MTKSAEKLLNKKVIVVGGNSESASVPLKHSLMLARK